jgi:selenide,water dikinase
MRQHGADRSTHVVLVGGGHTHVQVLRSWWMRPVPSARLTVVVDRAVAVYSGMVPALVAGELSRHELEIDLRPLAKRAGAAFVVAPWEGVDTEAGRVHLRGRPPLGYDLLSLNLGATVASCELPGVREHALASRPIADLVEGVGEAIRRLRGSGRGAARVVVVGGGAGGVELACCVEARLRAEGLQPDVTLVSAGPGSLGDNKRLLRLLQRTLPARGVRLEAGRRVVEVLHKEVLLDDGRRLPADLTLWVAGAAAHEVVARSGLPVDARGYLLVRDTLQVVGHDQIFAAGDCAVLQDHPWVPRAGVYAVRAGPVLDANLRASVGGAPLRRWRPQRDFLSMLNLGDRTAIVAKWGLAARGGWVWRWKNRIDRQFMERFQVLDAAGVPTPAFAGPMHGAEQMDCGGCAAKVGSEALACALDALPVQADPRVVLGLSERDDVAVVRYGAGSVVVSVDAFPAFTEDAWLVGRAAALNAVSDLHAKGAVPRHALAWLSVPAGAQGAEALRLALDGVRTTLAGEGVTLVGGHTTVAERLTVGLAVLGDPPVHGALWTQAGAQPGDRLVLTGRLGTGVLWRADAMGRASGAWMGAVVEGMLTPTAPLVAAARGFVVRAATDVTGFGLAGHAAGLASASSVEVELWAERLPLYDGVAELLAQGVRSTAHPANAARHDVEVAEEVDAVRGAVVFDPQTCGGLLFAVAEAEAEALARALRLAGGEACVVGCVRAAGAARVRVVSGP